MFKSTRTSSKLSSTESTSSSSGVESYLASFQQSSLRPLTPPEVPTYPTFFELVGRIDEDPKPQPRRRLFESLIGDPRVLFYGLLDMPDAFSVGAADLIQSIIAGTKKLEDLSEEELTQLDVATVDFIDGKRPKVKEPERRVEEEEKGEADLEFREGGGAVPVLDLPQAQTFWWRSSLPGPTG